MDLHARTAAALDWPVIVEALASHARTTFGAATCRNLSAHDSAEAIRADFDAIEDLRRIEELAGPLPIGGVIDIRPSAGAAARGMVLDPPALREAATALVALRQVSARLQEHADEAPRIAKVGEAIDIDGWVADELDRAFDPAGQLSASTYPELGELRQRIADLHETIRRTLEDLLRGDQLADVLQDKFVTQRGDRYVLPIKAHAKRWDIGIVHGTSGSGRTVFVEPNEVIALNNRLRLAEGELEAAEHRILAALSSQFGRIAPSVEVALEAATALDLACAREGLARQLGGTRPSVGGDGVVDLRGARHPVLQLRGVAVIPNDLSVTPDRPVLVLTGPNTGGKTVALKTIGLCAMMVRVGCFVPAAEGSRVDRFDDVIADIGDTQTVQGDLSSFSGHLVVLREMLSRARTGVLYLLDELCSGTDPAQGGALARAVLERLLDRGPRVVVTTHYAQLKGLASVDERFALAAMDYVAGRPTYRVVHGATGESHALETALRMGLDAELIDRARGLMSESERALQDALAALEHERARAERIVAEVDHRREALDRREREVAVREEDVRRRARELEQREAARFLDRLRQAEKAIGAVVADLQRSPDHRRVEAARATVAALRDLVPEQPAPPPLPAVARPGDRVRHRALGQVGEVIAVADSSAQVRVGALSVRARLDDLEVLSRAEPAPLPPTRTVRPAAEPTVDVAEAVRVGGNTIDLRGTRVDEAFDEVDLFFDRAVRSGRSTVFLLHGHGTGALKDALRKWLHSHARVRAFAPANADQGGDAYTAVALK